MTIEKHEEIKSNIFQFQKLNEADRWRHRMFLDFESGYMFLMPEIENYIKTIK